MLVSSPTLTSESVPVPTLSPHAAAQARYRAKNPDTEKEKAKLRMRRLREERKRKGTEENIAKAPTAVPDTSHVPDSILKLSRQELWASHDFKEFTEYCDKVKSVTLTFDASNPQEVEYFKQFMSTNPCVEDLPPHDEEEVEWRYFDHLMYNRYSEWREELADYRDIIAEMTSEELDKCQLEARRRVLPHTLLARGGF